MSDLITGGQTIKHAFTIIGCTNGRECQQSTSTIDNLTMGIMPRWYLVSTAGISLLLSYSSYSTGYVFARWGPNHQYKNYVQRHHPLSSATSPPVDNVTDRHVKTVDLLSLDSIRSTLIRQEETIIFAMIERAQFRQNEIVYQKDGLGKFDSPIGSVEPDPSFDIGDTRLSFMEYMLVGTEALHCRARRYKSPEEHAFFPERLPSTIQVLPDLHYSPELLSPENGAANVNFNKRLLQTYISHIVPAICRVGDDEQHGSTALCDIAVLQAVSRRVHYGKFVAESKYQSDPIAYQQLVNADDADGVMKLLTDPIVEEKVLRRARLKAATYGTEPLLSELPPIEGTDAISTLVAAAAASAVVAALSALKLVGNEGDPNHNYHHCGSKVDPSVIEHVYRTIIIPMTKDIEVAYLFYRCGKTPPPAYRE